MLTAIGASTRPSYAKTGIATWKNQTSGAGILVFRYNNALDSTSEYILNVSNYIKVRKAAATQVRFELLLGGATKNSANVNPSVGSVYGIGFRFTDGVLRYFVNGQQLGTDLSYTGATTNGNSDITLFAPTGVDKSLSLGRIILFNPGTLPTDDEIKAGTMNPGQAWSVAPGSIWTLQSESEGTVSTLDDSGANDFDLTLSAGNPQTMSPLDLSPTPPWTPSFEISTGGRILAVSGEWKIAKGTALPTLNNGAKSYTFAATDVIAWGGKVVGYLLPADNKVLPSETVTVTAGADLVRKAADGAQSGPVTNVAITNKSGIEILATAMPAEPRMPVWAGNDRLPYYHGSDVINIAQQTDKWLNVTSGDYDISLINDQGLPTTTGARVYTMRDWGSEGAWRMPTGNFLLRWKDASGQAGVSDVQASQAASALDGGALTWDATRQMKVRRYAVTENHNGVYLTVANPTGVQMPVQLLLESEISDLDNYTLSRRMRKRARGIKGLRCMARMGTNTAGLRNAEDITPDPYFLADKGKKTVRVIGNVEALAIVTDTTLDHRGTGGVIQVTITGHGLTTGDPVVLSGTGATITSTTASSIDNYAMAARVIDANTFNLKFYKDGTLSYTGGGSASVTVEAGPSPEQVAREVNDFPDLEYVWLAVPHLMSDACWTAWFTRFMAVLRSDLIVLIEYGNEQWNTLQPYALGADYCWLMADASDLTYGEEWSALRTQQLYQIANTIASGRVRYAIFGHTANPLVLQRKLAYAAAQGYTVHYAGAATYFGALPSGISSDTALAMRTSMDADTFIDCLAYNLDPEVRETTWKANADLALAAGAIPVPYEGHLHEVPGTNTTLQELYKRVILHPRMRYLTWKWAATSASCGYAVAQKFTLTGPHGAAGLWGAYQGWDEEAGTGDGSDGQHDNTSDWSTKTSVSVVGLALKEWAGVSDVDVTAPVATLLSMTGLIVGSVDPVIVTVAVTGDPTDDWQEGIYGIEDQPFEVLRVLDGDPQETYPIYVTGGSTVGNAFIITFQFNPDGISPGVYQVRYTEKGPIDAAGNRATSWTTIVDGQRTAKRKGRSRNRTRRKHPMTQETLYCNNGCSQSFNLRESRDVTIQVVNTGDVALSDFKIEVQVHPDSSFEELEVDFAVPDLGVLLYCSANPAALEPEAKAQIKLDLGGFYAVRFYTSGKATVRINA